MKRLCLAAVVSCFAAPAALAEEHFTEGSVWECNSYRTKQGHFDDYMKYLRQNFLPPSQEAKKAGLVQDQKVYLHVPTNPTEPDRSEEHTSELQSQSNLVCRLLLEKKKKKKRKHTKNSQIKTNRRISHA